MMNPQHYYQYQMAAPPAMQAIPNQMPASYIAAASAGGVHLGMPPPPPPGALLTAPKTMIPPPSKMMDPPPASPVGVETPDNHISHDGSDTEAMDKTISEAQERGKSLTASASTSLDMMPAGSLSSPNQPSAHGSVYAGAYIHPNLSQPSTSMASFSGVHPQYVLAPGASPLTVPQAHKLVYLPPSIPNAVAGGSYYIPQTGLSTPTMVTDQSGKQLMVGSPVQMPVQYQLAAPGGLKPSMPQQYMLAPSPYYNTLQGQHNAALQQVYAPVQGVPAPQNTAGFGALGGLAQNPSMSGSHVYYYQY